MELFCDSLLRLFIVHAQKHSGVLCVDYVLTLRCNHLLVLSSFVFMSSRGFIQTTLYAEIILLLLSQFGGILSIFLA